MPELSVSLPSLPTKYTTQLLEKLYHVLQDDVDVMDMTELRQSLHVALNEAVRLRAETDSLKTTHVR